MKAQDAFWKLNQDRISRKNISLFLDYDGTLSPIVRDPARARPPREILAVLKKLHGMKRIRMAVVSGRNLKSLETFLPFKGLTLAGNHGAVIRGRGVRFIAPGLVRFRRRLPALKSRVCRKLAAVDGLRYEMKTYGFTIHYRGVDPAQVRRARVLLRAVLASELSEKRVRLRKGKKVWELCAPEDWNKGSAVLWLWKKFGRKSFPIYIGDDLTDEDAFRVLPRFSSLKVISRPSRSSAADFYLKSWREVAAFLKHLAVILEDPTHDRF